MVNYVAFQKTSSSVPQIVLSGGVLKASANLGCIVGQLMFGIFGDVFGRKAVYGKELMVTIVATILLISSPNVGTISGESVFTWITCWRVLMGIGIGGDYPMSASVVSDRANLKRRGTLLAFIFAMQGWGNFSGAIVTLIVLSCFRTGIRDHHNYGQFNAVWRIMFGIILVPSFLTLYQRLTLPESTKFKAVEKIRADKENKIINADDPKVALQQSINNNQNQDDSEVGLEKNSKNSISNDREIQPEVKHDEGEGKEAKLVFKDKMRAFNEFAEYFSDWRHARTLFATAMCWLLLDVTFYGINLNQSIVIDAIGMNKSTEPFQHMWDNTIANLIITVAGFLPGYYVSMFTIEYIGRKWLQFGGFLLEALFLGIVAGDFVDLQSKPAGFVVCFAFLQFFFNFGANMTTFVIPAEVFPTRVKGFAHGFSAACGKAGAVAASLGFSKAANSIGTANVLWIFFAISIVGAAVTLLLPETKGRDADIVDLEERRAALAASAATL